MREHLLTVDSLAKSFAGVRALDGYSLRLPPLIIHGIIGPNGAGKTTLFNLLTGFIKPTAGTIHLRAREITRLPAYRVARLGMARTFQNIRLFGQLSVIDNVKAALQSQMPQSLPATLLSTPGFRRREHELEQRALALLVSLRSPARSRSTRRSCCWTSRMLA